jgi:hypothetical protein
VVNFGEDKNHRCINAQKLEGSIHPWRELDEQDDTLLLSLLLLPCSLNVLTTFCYFEVSNRVLFLAELLTFGYFYPMYDTQ